MSEQHPQGKGLILLDLDGIVFKHWGSLVNLVNNPTEVLPGVQEHLQKWYLEDRKIVITTGRQESMREFTEKQLSDNNIFYNQLIMDVGRGVRTLINDRKPDFLKDTAVAFTIERNKGMEGLEI